MKPNSYSKNNKNNNRNNNNNNGNRNNSTKKEEVEVDMIDLWGCPQTVNDEYVPPKKVSNPPRNKHKSSNFGLNAKISKNNRTQSRDSRNKTNKTANNTANNNKYNLNQHQQEQLQLPIPPYHISPSTASTTSEKTNPSPAQNIIQTQQNKHHKSPFSPSISNTNKSHPQHQQHLRNLPNNKNKHNNHRHPINKPIPPLPNTSPPSSSNVDKAPLRIPLNVVYSNLSWLRPSDNKNDDKASKILSDNEINAIFALKNNEKSLSKQAVDTLYRRINHLMKYSSNSLIQKYAGLCKMDEIQRIKIVLNLLSAYKKEIDNKIAELFRIKTVSNFANEAQAKQWEADKTLTFNAIKDHSHIVNEYQELIRFKPKNPKINKENNNIMAVDNINQKEGIKQNTEANKDNIDKEESITPQPKSYSHLTYTDENLHFGIDDEWDHSLNPIYSVLHRGHMLNEEDYDQYLRLTGHDDFDLLTDNDGDEIYTDDDNNNDNEDDEDDDIKMNDTDIDDDEEYNALLGPSGPPPPGIDILGLFRSQIAAVDSSGVNELEDNQRNMILLYGKNHPINTRYNNGLYQAHLLSEYEVCDKVGSGVYGQVFKAKTKSTKKTVAIKVLPLLHHGDMLQNLKIKEKRLAEEKRNLICPYIYPGGINLPIFREIVALKQLKHSNITKLYDIVLNDPDQLYLEKGSSLRTNTVLEYNNRNKESTRWNFHLVMEYIPNELCAMMKNLKVAYIRDQNIKSKFDKRIQYRDEANPEKYKKPPKDARFWFGCSDMKSIVYELIDGLKYLKDECYIHRDLKPANILLTDNGRIKIADFGLSRPKYKKEHLTNGKNVVTRYYRAPEILVEQNKRKSEYGIESDMWSVGCIFAELITGRPIFRAESDSQQIHAIKHYCGGINNQTWPGIDNVTPRDPYPQKGEGVFIPKTETFKWNDNIVKPRLFPINSPIRTGNRIINQYLTEFIRDSWTAVNIREGLDLLNKILCYSPKHRITPEQALKHRWFTIAPTASPPKELIKKSKETKGATHTDLQQQQLLYKQARSKQKQQQKQNNKNISETQQRINAMNRRNVGNHRNQTHNSLLNHNNNNNRNRYNEEQRARELYNKPVPTFNGPPYNNNNNNNRHNNNNMHRQNNNNNNNRNNNYRNHHNNHNNNNNRNNNNNNYMNHPNNHNQRRGRVQSERDLFRREATNSFLNAPSALGADLMSAPKPPSKKRRLNPN